MGAIGFEGDLIEGPVGIDVLGASPADGPFDLDGHQLEPQVGQLCLDDVIALVDGTVTSSMSDVLGHITGQVIPPTIE